ncbi:MAG: restriction endonuclease [Nitrospirae bacterium RBG_13_39_12]|nr:MAG: restriction endonuclease [Nitrospirae bacterium RBG_13_39_12]
MSIPDYQAVMLPLLKILADEQEHSFRDSIENLAQFFKLSAEERKELLPSGQQKVFDNRIGWARTYLKKAGLMESTRRGFFKITKLGLDALKQNPPEINVKFLEQYPEFIEFKQIRKEKVSSEIEEIDKQSPEDLVVAGYQKIRQELADELLAQIKSCSPEFFEKLLVELLVKMGYGGSRKDAGKAIGKTGDEGIDGIIKEDKLGLDTIYIQAKRWENTVSRPEIQKFAGALQGHRAKKGIFITTSSFSKEALDFVSKIDSKIILIDGEHLTQLMIDYDIGVSKIASYDIKKIDTDYFLD